LFSNTPALVFPAQLARPNILMFGDNMWDDDRYFSQDQDFQEYLGSMSNTNCCCRPFSADGTVKRKKSDNTCLYILGADNGASKVVVIELGAGLSVPTVRMQGEDFASDTYAFPYN
jgi:hypothetical protein